MSKLILKTVAVCGLFLCLDPRTDEVLASAKQSSLATRYTELAWIPRQASLVLLSKCGAGVADSDLFSRFRSELLFGAGLAETYARFVELSHIEIDRDLAYIFWSAASGAEKHEIVGIARTRPGVNLLFETQRSIDRRKCPRQSPQPGDRAGPAPVFTGLAG